MRVSQFPSSFLIFLWYNRFKEGHEDVNDDARSSRMSTSTTYENIAAVKKMITIREVAHVKQLFIFHSFLGIKRAAANIVRKSSFGTIEEKKEKSKQELLTIPKNAFQKCFEDWEKCWHKCIISEVYFEVDKLVIDK